MIAALPFQTVKALGIALLGYTLWVFSDAFMKAAGTAGLPSYETVAFLGLFSCGFLILKTGAQGKLETLWPKNPRLQAGRGILSVICNVANVIALTHLPLAAFFVTVFVAPILIALLAGFFLKEKITLGTMLAILAGFGGVFYAVAAGKLSGQGDWIGYTAAIISALAFALSTVTLRMVKSRNETLDSLGFFSALCQAAFGLIGMACYHSVTVSGTLVLILMGMSFFGIVGNLANYWAVRHTSAGLVGALHYSQLVTGAIIGYLIWHEVPTLHMLIGAVVIILSGIYVVTHAYKTARASAQVL